MLAMQVLVFFFSVFLLWRWLATVLYTISACPITKAFTGWGLLTVISVLRIPSKCYPLRLVYLRGMGGGGGRRMTGAAYEVQLDVGQWSNGVV